MKRFLALLSAPCWLAMGLWAPAALAQERSERPALEQGAASATGQIEGNDSVQYQPARAAPGVEVGFSPEGSAHRLVLQTIAGAQQSIQMLAYAFQAPTSRRPWPMRSSAACRCAWWSTGSATWARPAARPWTCWCATA
jgi:hypothetical protein